MDKIDIANQTIAKHVAETLNKHYPGHMWLVHADILQGICSVRNQRLSSNMGFMIHLDDLSVDTTDKTIISAGGELLERFRLSRGSFNESEYVCTDKKINGDLVYDT